MVGKRGWTRILRKLRYMLAGLAPAQLGDCNADKPMSNSGVMVVCTGVSADPFSLAVASRKTAAPHVASKVARLGVEAREHV